MRVSFDFDQTLSEVDVYDYAKQLISSGVEVWIVTARYNDNLNPNHDIKFMCNELNIPKNHVVYMGMKDKYEFFVNNQFLFHLDDDVVEVELINDKTDTVGILKNKNWRNNCDKILNKWL